MKISKTYLPAGGTTHRSSWRGSTFVNSSGSNFDIPESLLAAVDFKWLMAGHGWWVDNNRFHDDPVYASKLLHSALGSESPTLRRCAAEFLARIACEQCCDAVGQAPAGPALRTRAPTAAASSPTAAA